MLNYTSIQRTIFPLFISFMQHIIMLNHPTIEMLCILAFIMHLEQWHICQTSETITRLIRRAKNYTSNSFGGFKRHRELCLKV